MNIIQTQRENRLRRIAKLRATLEKAFKDNLSIDYEYIIAQAGVEWGASRRYALELINQLKNSMAFTIETNAGIKQIIPPDKKDQEKKP